LLKYYISVQRRSLQLQ